MPCTVSKKNNTQWDKPIVGRQVSRQVLIMNSENGSVKRQWKMTLFVELLLFKLSCSWLIFKHHFIQCIMQIVSGCFLDEIICESHQFYCLMYTVLTSKIRLEIQAIKVKIVMLGSTVYDFSRHFYEFYELLQCNFWNFLFNSLLKCSLNHSEIHL